MTQTNKKPPLKWSFSKGISFYFRDDDNEIIANGSLFTGHEAIYLNSKKVSGKRSFSKESLHQFSSETSRYEIEYKTESILKGNLTCTLIKDNVHFKTISFISADELAKLPTTDTKKTSWLSFFTWVVSGFIFGSLVAHFFKSGI